MVTQLQYQVTGHPGLPGLSTLNFIGDADAGSAEDTNVRVQAFWTSLEDNIRSGIEIAGTGVATIKDDATGETTAQHPVSSWTVTCGNPSTPLPLGTQGLVLLRTGIYVNGREIRGRVFIPSPTDSSLGSDGLPLSASKTIWTSAVETHLWEGPEFQLGVWSPTHLQMVPLSAVVASPYFARLSTRQR